MPSKDAFRRVASSLRATLPKQSNEQVVIPARCTDFAKWVGVELSAGQRAIFRVAFDGESFDELEPDELAAARIIFGGISDVPQSARAVVGAVCGGRGGKTHRLISVRLVHGMLVRDLSSLAAGQRAVSLVVAPNDKLRQEAVNYALGVMRSRPELARRLVLPKGCREDDTPSEFGVRHDSGHIVMFESGVATRGGYGGRGRSFTDFAMDESAFFHDSSYKVNDADIFRAPSARVLPGGQSIVASTPWAESGLLYDMWSSNWGKPNSALVAHAPTLLLNPSDWAREMVQRERLRDPDNAAREFDAKFMAGGTTVFFDAASIGAAIDDSLDQGRTALAGETVAAGADFGFRSDSSALAVAHRSSGVVRVGELLELRPEEGRPLKPSETVKAFAAALKRHGCSYLMADQHYRETIDEHLTEANLAYAPAPNTPADAYMRARALFREGRVRIPNNPRLIQQLKEVQGRPTPGGGMSITQPRWRTGGHGDLVSALVLALYQLGGDEVKETEPATVEDLARDARRKAAKERAERPYWHASGGNNPFSGR